MKPLTMVGRGESWRECPFNTEEIWGAATCLITEGLADKPYTKVFAFDGDLDKRIKQSLEVARSRNLPIVSSEHYATEVWPSREIVKDTGTSYFLDTISRMLGYAIYLRYQKIFLYGIDYGPQWANMQSKAVVSFWLGYAMGRGIDIRLGRGSMKWVYTLGPLPEGTPAELPLRERISENICVSA